MEFTNISHASDIIDALFFREIFGDGPPVPKTQAEQEICKKEFNRQKERLENLYSDSLSLARIGVLSYDGEISELFITQDQAQLVVKILCLMQVLEEEAEEI